MASFKQEEPIKPEAVDDLMEDDDDQYEDTGELQFPKELPETWLVRVPKDLWSVIDDMKMDDEIQLGELQMWTKPGAIGPNKVRWKINDNARGFDLVAKEYEMDRIDVPSGVVTGPRNIFVFSEKDKAGYRPNLFRGGYGRQQRQGQDAGKKTEGGRIEKKQRGPRTIPKHTAYVSAPTKEMHCTPRENDAWNALQKRKQALQASMRHDTKIRNIVKTDPLMRGDESFLNIGENRKPRQADNKYQRIDEAALIDLLSLKFKQFRFWPFSALQLEVKQPEAYLREVLGKIAMMVRTGQANNTWTLKPSAAAAVNFTEEEMAKYEESQTVAPDATESSQGAPSVPGVTVSAPDQSDDNDSDISISDDDDDDVGDMVDVA